MNLNPEFQRQLNLECSQARLIAAPLILGVIFSFSYLLDNHQLGQVTAQTALTLFLLISLLWGARQSLDSIMEEYRDRTWDTQRLSALGPWQMTWGKLFGSTSMVWYCAGICLLVYTLSTDNPDSLPSLYFYTLVTALLVQAVGLLLGQLAVQRGQHKNSSVLTLAFVGFVFVAPKLFNLSELSGHFPQWEKTVFWYSISISEHKSHQISLLSALIWCNIGNYRLMSQELGIRHQPWAWLGFAAFLIIYLGGFIPNDRYSFSLAAFIVSSTLTYISLFVERHEPMRIKRLASYWQQSNWKKIAEELPLSWLSFALTLPFAVSLSIGEQAMMLLSDVLHLYPLAIVLLIFRDSALYLFFSYGENPQRAFSLSLLSAVLLYVILPGVFSAIGLTGIAALFFPLWADSALSATLCGLLQCTILLRLLYQRWQRGVTVRS